MSEPRVIKKYENRRLYDTQESRYVNLDEVAHLVRDGEDIQVVDAKSGEDLTRLILTQIIVEDSRGSEGGPPLEFLRDLVKSTDKAQKDFLHWYLGTAAESYEKMRRSWPGAMPWPSLSAQREALAKMFDPFGAMRSMMGNAGETGAAADEEDAPEPQTGPEEEDIPEDEERASADEELADLRKRLEELEKRLR